MSILGENVPRRSSSSVSSTRPRLLVRGKAKRTRVATTALSFLKETHATAPLPSSLTAPQPSSTLIGPCACERLFAANGSRRYGFGAGVGTHRRDQYVLLFHLMVRRSEEMVPLIV